jgi:hypothetical protein
MFLFDAAAEMLSLLTDAAWLFLRRAHGRHIEDGGVVNVYV